MSLPKALHLLKKQCPGDLGIMKLKRQATLRANSENLSLRAMESAQRQTVLPSIPTTAKFLQKM